MYLIAAEADVGLGNTAEAATDGERAASSRGEHGAQERLQRHAGQMTLDYIMDERERELAGEFTRWYDMVRPGADSTSWTA